MSRPLAMAEEKATQRTVTVTTYKAHGGKAVVEGRLTECRGGNSPGSTAASPSSRA